MRDDVTGGQVQERGRRGRRLLLGLAVVVVVVGMGWAVVRGGRSVRFQVRMLRAAVNASAAPDELVVVDGRVLGWVLRQGGAGTGAAGFEVTSDEVAPSSLLADLDEHRREIVVVARPGSRLIRTLSAAGYVLVQRPGQAAWDTASAAAHLTGWGGYRIFFVRLPTHPPVDAEPTGGAVESGMHSGMQHEMK